MPVELSVAKQLVWEHAGAWPVPMAPEQRAAACEPAMLATGKLPRGWMYL